MRVTRFTDIGLRILMYLGVQEREQPVTAAEIARQFEVPQNHVVKVVHRMAQLGWIATQRGRSGGLWLAVEPSKLRIGDVLQALEGQESLIDCAEPRCVLIGRCRLKGALDKALAGFYRELNQATLADMCVRNTGQAILQMHRAFVALRAA